MSLVVVRQVVDVVADHLSASRTAVLAAGAQHRDVSGLSRWFAREVAGALWDARFDLSDVPFSLLWRATETAFLLSPVDDATRTAPAQHASDLWVEALAVPPAARSIEIAGSAIRLASAQLDARRLRRRVGTFVALAAVMVRDQRDLAVDLLIATVGEPAARARFTALDADGGLRGDLFAWIR